jgi:hypothetical protein
MSPWLHAAVTLGALAAWVTIVLVIAGLWRPGQRWRRARRLGRGAQFDTSQLPTEHAPYRDQAER